MPRLLKDIIVKINTASVEIRFTLVKFMLNNITPKEIYIKTSIVAKMRFQRPILKRIIDILVGVTRSDSSVPCICSALIREEKEPMPTPI